MKGCKYSGPRYDSIQCVCVCVCVCVLSLLIYEVRIITVNIASFSNKDFHYVGYIYIYIVYTEGRYFVCN